jgi:hypothetical protein
MATAGFPAQFYSPGTNEAGTLLLSTANTRDINQDAFLIRTDHQLTRRVTAYFRYAFAQPSATTSTRAIASVPQGNKRRWQSGMAQLVFQVTPNQILEVRAGLLRTRMRDTPSGRISQQLIDFGVDPQLGLNFKANGTALSLLTVPASTGFLDNETVPQVSAQHSWTRGRWTLRSGLDIRHLNLNVLLISNATFFQTNGIVGRTGLIGSSPSQPEVRASEFNATLYGLNGGPTTPLRGWRATEQEYFTQSDIRLTRALTLNAGLRYSFFGTYQVVGGYAGNLYAVDNSGKILPSVSSTHYGPYQNVVAGVAPNRPFHQPYFNSWQPRFGIAWDLGGRATTILRAGWGIYSDRFLQRLFDFGVLNPPYALSGVLQDYPAPPGLRFPLRADTPPQGRFIDPTLRNPKTYRFNVALEQKIAKETSITVAYVGLRAHGLYRWQEPNGQAQWPQALRPDTRYSRYRLVQNLSSSAYDSLQIFARRRFTAGLDFTAAYTYSRSVDDYSGDVGDVQRPFSTAQVQFPTLINLGCGPGPKFVGCTRWDVAPRPVQSDRGPSDFDTPHNLSISHLYELPLGRGRRFLSDPRPWVNALVGGFSLAGIFTFRSGEPFSVRTGNDYAKIGDVSTLRPALLTGTLDGVYAHDGDKTQWLVGKPAINTLLGDPANVTDPFAPIGRNSLRSPKLISYDLSLLKRWQLREGWKLQFEANAFNVFNRAQLGEPILTLTDARFGRIISTRNGTTPRQVQLGLKLRF